jgi:Hypervirulence associated proteins TUDOR domain
MTAKRFKPGDHVSWNSEAGVVRGRITRIVTSPTKFKRYTVHGSSDEPQYEIKSDTRDHIAMHKGSALTKLRT